MQIEYERGISNPGNLYRMKKLMARAEAGETLNIGFLGGSITQGCLASAPELCYAYRVFQWWEKTFPQDKFHYINAGIGGTTSHFGTARAESDLLSHKPDLLSLNFRSMMNRRNFSVRHMKDWYAVYGRMKTNLL